MYYLKELPPFFNNPREILFVLSLHISNFKKIVNYVGIRERIKFKNAIDKLS